MAAFFTAEEYGEKHASKQQQSNKQQNQVILLHLIVKISNFFINTGINGRLAIFKVTDSGFCLIVIK